MRKFYILNYKLTFLLLVGFVLGGETLFSQVTTQTEVLKRAAVDHAAKEKVMMQQLEQLSRAKGWPMVIKGKNGKYAILSGMDPLGNPMYTATFNNILSAATIRTDKLWPGGSTGINLNGSSSNIKGKLAIWDGGAVKAGHQELIGRILKKDIPTDTLDHSTHVAGTLIASGVNPLAKGMAFGLQQLIAYDFNSHLSEMLAESPNLLASNHSYGAIAGWYFNDNQNRWEWWGPAGATEDYKFGYYDATSQMLDSIAFNAPNYLIVKSVGNNRDENGPAVGQPYYRYNSSNVMVAAGNRPGPPNAISNNDSYDCIPTYGVAKNILTVGAINPIPGGYNQPQDVVMTTFSSWGPTDDGRIKPDVVTDGVNVLSCVATSNTDYQYMTGTSMSTPAAAGSVMLLQEYYTKMHPTFPFLRSATIKGIVIHTADDAGTSPGPDYSFGWGLINMERAASMITSNNTDQLIQENTLNNGQTFSLDVVASGKGPLVVTISWTDPKADYATTNLLNDPTKKLVNDLDVRVKKGATTYMPWILDPNNRANAATQGDNVLDNVEKIEIPNAVPGQTYTITVTHKGTLQRGSQAYSLLVSGVGGTAYCTSAPSANAGARIDSVSLGNLHKGNPGGCTTYTDFTGTTVDLEPNSTVPLFIKLSSCDATNVDKIVSVYIDLNNNGVFTDAGEMVAQSAVINGNGNFTTNITVPGTVKPGNYAIMRVVVEETSSPAGLSPCGPYTRGETQDYRVHIANPSNDMGMVEVISPDAAGCANASQFLSVHIKNYGSGARGGFPVSATVKAGATTVATLSGTYPGIIPGYGETIYTFQAPFNAAPGTTYTITSQVSLPGDQNTSNDQNVSTIVINSLDASQSGTGEICNNTQAFLKTAATDFDGFFWYNSSTATTPIAAGSTATIAASALPANHTLYLGKNDYYNNVGPANKAAWPDGGYNYFSGNFVNFTCSVPLIIQTAKLYIGKPGPITFIVADISNFDPSTGNYQYRPYSSVTVDAYQTSPTVPIPGNPFPNPADTGNVFLLNLVVPVAGNHSIIIVNSDSAMIFRNNNIPSNPYPIGQPGVFTFTGNSAVTTGNPNLYQTYYYFFYDVRLAFGNCPSSRASVLVNAAPTPVISLNGNTFTSNIASGNQWYKNSAVIPGATAQTYNAQTSGTYYTVVTDSFGCATQSNSLPLTVTGVPTIDPSTISLKVLPNPNNGSFLLKFNVRDKADLTISLVDMIGQEVYRNIYPGFTGDFTKQMELGKMPSGVYLLKLQHGSKLYVKKLVIAN